jgi:hypothetical protein
LQENVNDFRLLDVQGHITSLFILDFNSVSLDLSFLLFSSLFSPLLSFSLSLSFPLSVSLPFPLSVFFSLVSYLTPY